MMRRSLAVVLFLLCASLARGAEVLAYDKRIVAELRKRRP